MLPVGSLISDAATGVGLLAASIAVFGFLGQVQPALTHREDPAVRAATIVGGLLGLFVGISIIILEVW